MRSQDRRRGHCGIGGIGGFGGETMIIGICLRQFARRHRRRGLRHLHGTQRHGRIFVSARLGNRHIAVGTHKRRPSAGHHQSLVGRHRQRADRFARKSRQAHRGQRRRSRVIDSAKYLPGCNHELTAKTAYGPAPFERGQCRRRHGRKQFHATVNAFARTHIHNTAPGHSGQRLDKSRKKSMFLHNFAQLNSTVQSYARGNLICRLKYRDAPFLPLEL